METVRKFEKTLADWYRNVPHLPKGGQKWLADNVWWIVIIGIVLSVMGLFGIVSALLFAGLGMTLGGAMMPGSYGVMAGAFGGFIVLSMLLALAVYIVELVLMVLAISPLKEHKKRGWEYLFLIAVVNFAFVVVNAVMTMHPLGLLWGLFWGVLWSAVGVYFLFEIRGYFEAAHKAATKKSEPKKAKA